MAGGCSLQTTKDINERFFKLIETIEGEIDPFDLNVLSPYMQSHLQKIAPRSSVGFVQREDLEWRIDILMLLASVWPFGHQ